MSKDVAHSETISDSAKVMVESVNLRDGLAEIGEKSPILFFENLKWLTSREAVVYLRLPSTGALRNLVYRRKIPFVRLGRRLRFDREALNRFLESSFEQKRRIA